MVMYKNATTLGMVLKLPILSVDDRQQFKDIIKAAEDIRDKDTSGFLSDMLTRIDMAEATMHNLNKTLNVYRSRIPKIIRTLHTKKKEVSK